jgi:SH3-like domain-containing protein
MNKKFRLTVLILAALLIVSIVIAETLIIKVKTTNLRKEPKFYSPTIVVLKAGESVEKIETKGDWFKVKTTKGTIGWLHSSAVQTKKLRLASTDKSLRSSASAEEVAMASKGFNKQVEDSYKAKHGDVSYAWVDRMLKLTVSAKQIESFLKRGKLGEFGGAK